MMKKSVVVTLLILASLFFANFVLAEQITEDLHVNLQTTDATGKTVTGTFAFVFNISTTSNCANVIYTNSTTLTTDDRGIISYYLPNVSLNFSQQYYLCYYRDGSLKDSTKIARTPYSFTTKNITISGIIADSNFNISPYNMTAAYFFGSGRYLTDLDVGAINLSSYLTYTGAYKNIDLGSNNLTINVSTFFVNTNTSRVGIGTTTPLEKLQVNGNILANGTINATTDLCIQGGICLKGVSATASGEPYWTANYSAFNATWSNTYNATENASINNSIFSNNVSMRNYVNLQNASMNNSVFAYNTSMKNYVDSQNLIFNASNNNSMLAMNTTLMQILNNGSYFNTAYLDTFIANYSTFLTHITFGQVSNGTIWSWVMNGTLAKSSELNNGSYLNYPWNATNTSYLEIRYWNATNTSYMTGDNFTLQNTSMQNYVLYTNSTMKSYVDSKFLTSYTETDPYWTANYSAFNATWSNTYNATENASINNSIFSNNVSMRNYVNLQNASMNNSVFAYNTSMRNYVNSQDLIFNASNNNSMLAMNTTLMQILNNGSYFNTAYLDTFIANYSTFLTHITFGQVSNGTIWSWVMNGTVMQGDNFTLQNTSMRNYVNLQNQSAVNWANSTFIKSSEQANLNVNNSQYLDGYDSSFFMPLNTSVYGQFDYNGGWQNNGLSIINGNLYAQAGYFYNISSLQVTNLNINGSLLPYNGLDNQFDIGSPALRWNEGFFGGNLYVNGSVYSNNQVVITNEVDPYWTANYSAFNTTWSNTYNATENASINNSIFSNNVSMRNYVNLQNASMNNSVFAYNTSMRNYVNLQNASMNNSVFAYNTSMRNYVDSQNLIFNASNNNSMLAMNTTLMQILNNGSYFNSAYLDTFIANYSTFLTHITFGQVSNGTIWSWVMNGTVAKSSELNNGSYLNYPWNATNTSYMTGDNFTLQNASMQNYVFYTNSTMKSYVDYVNSTNGGSAYNDAWINQTLIPYTGANKNINLGNNNLTINVSTFVVDTNNSRVGIGTANPGYKLHVVPEASSVGIYVASATSSTGIYGLGGNVGVQGGGTNVGVWGSGANYDFYGATATAKNYFAGSVGVGTTSPIGKLHVVGNTSITGGNFSVNTSDLFVNTNNSRVGIGTANPAYSLDVYDAVGYHNSVRIYTNGINRYSQLIFQNAAGSWSTGMNTDETYFINEASTTRIKINAGGDTGIGTSTPLTKLHVNGSILANGTINATTDLCIQGGICLSGVSATASGEPYWTANYSAFNTTWSNTYNATENASINNSIFSNNVSMRNYVNLQNTSMNNSVFAYNTSMRNYVNLQNTSMNNSVFVYNTSMRNYVDSQAAGWSNITNYSYVPYTGANRNLDLGTNNLSVSTSLLFVDSTNNEIGIATANPFVDLHVNGDILANGTINGTTDVCIQGGNCLSGSLTNASIGNTYVPYTGANRNINLGNNNLTVNATTLFVNTNNSRVGLGTTDPLGTLDVRGNLYANNTAITGNLTVLPVNNNRLGVGIASPTYIFEVNTTLNTWAAVIRNYGRGTAANGLFVSTNNGAGASYTLGVYSYARGAYDLIVTGNGNTGLGTTGPISKLDVRGNMSVNDTIITGNANITGNLNMTGANTNLTMGQGQKTCYTQDCSKYIQYNGTALIIQG